MLFVVLLRCAVGVGALMVNIWPNKVSGAYSCDLSDRQMFDTSQVDLIVGIMLAFKL